MRLSSPKLVTWWIAVILGILGLIGSIATIPVLTDLAFWLVLAGLVLLALATQIKDL